MPPTDQQHQHQVLVVDDDQDCLDALVEYLAHAGFTVDRALGGDAGLQRLQSGEAPCVVVTDVLMPDRDGWSLVAAMRADARLDAIPVVMVSGLPEHAGRAVRLRVRAYLPKPSRPADISDAVGRYCGHPAAVS